MEVNAGKSQDCGGSGARRKGRSQPTWGTYEGGGQGCPQGGGVGCCAKRMRPGLGSRRPAGALTDPCIAAARPGGAGRGPPLTWPGRASHVRAVFTFSSARAPVGWGGA